jgi:hypothetical protein
VVPWHVSVSQLQCQEGPAPADAGVSLAPRAALLLLCRLLLSFSLLRQRRLCRLLGCSCQLQLQLQLGCSQCSRKLQLGSISNKLLWSSLLPQVGDPRGQ